MRRIKAAAAALALLFGLSSAAVSAAQVLRTEIKMPALQLQIGSEADLSALTPADVKATLDGSPLTTASFAKNEDGVLYLVVLDISGSMPDGHFDAAKTAAAALFDGLRPQDKLRLYACGSKVRTVLEGGEDADTAKAAIEALRKGGSTLLYDAVETLLALLVRDYPVELEVDDSMTPLVAVVDNLLEAGVAHVVTETVTLVDDRV